MRSVIRCSTSHTHPTSCGSVQFFFVAKVIQFLMGHLAVIPTDELKHYFFRSQHGITSCTIDELMDALVYSLLFVL